MNYGRALVSLRAEHGMSRKDAAKATGLSTQTVNRIENDIANTERGRHLEKFAEAYGVSVDEIRQLAESFPDINKGPSKITDVEPISHDGILGYDARIQRIIGAPTVGAMVRQLRELYTLDIDELSAMTGVPVVSLENVENETGAFSYAEEQRLARFFEIPCPLFSSQTVYRVCTDTLKPKVAALQEHFGITIADLVSLTGLSTSTLTTLSIPGRVPATQTIKSLAAVFGIDPADLVAIDFTPDDIVQLAQAPTDSPAELGSVETESNCSTEPPAVVDVNAQNVQITNTGLSNAAVVVPTKSLATTVILNTAQSMFRMEGYTRSDFEELLASLNYLYDSEK